MTRRATIAALRRDLEETRSDMWEMAHDAADLRDQCKRLQYVIDRQDGTILALWGLIEQQADEAPSDCALYGRGCGAYPGDTCTASYAEGCGAYLAKDAP